MTQAEKVLKVAISQIGYCESPKNSNNTKYGKWMGVNYEPWCASFVVWCFYKAGLLNLVTKNASAAYLQDDIVNKRGGKWVMTKAYNNTKKKNALSKYRAGDVVTFDFGRNNGYRQHIGIIEKVSGNYVICIEGNTSKAGSQSNGGMVVRQRRIYSSICAVARPKWSDSKPDPKYTGKLPALPGRGWFQVGDKGEQVKLLQKFLVWCGFSVGSAGVDGEYGNATKNAVREFQSLYGLSVDGAWGKQCNDKAKTMCK